MRIDKRLSRVLFDLNEAAGFFEERGFGKEQARLDAAADIVEKIRDQIASLMEID